MADALNVPDGSRVDNEGDGGRLEAGDGVRLLNGESHPRHLGSKRAPSGNNRSQASPRTSSCRKPDASTSGCSACSSEELSSRIETAVPNITAFISRVSWPQDMCSTHPTPVQTRDRSNTLPPVCSFCDQLLSTTGIKHIRTFRITGRTVIHRSWPQLESAHLQSTRLPLLSYAGPTGSRPSLVSAKCGNTYVTIVEEEILLGLFCSSCLRFRLRLVLVAGAVRVLLAPEALRVMVRAGGCLECMCIRRWRRRETYEDDEAACSFFESRLWEGLSERGPTHSIVSAGMQAINNSFSQSRTSFPPPARVDNK